MIKTLLAAVLLLTLSQPCWALEKDTSSPLRAPVMTGPKPAWMEYKSPYAANEENSISSPHRTSEEIVTWAQQAAAEVLSFNPQNYKERIDSFKKYFAAQGWQQYADGLKTQKLINAVSDDGYSMGTIVNNPPEIISQDATGGAYHWVVKMPLSVSFFSVDMSGNVRTGPSYPYILFMNLTRTGEGGDAGIAINNWRMDAAPRTDNDD